MPEFSSRICCFWPGFSRRSFSGMDNFKKLYGGRQIVLVSPVGFSVLNTGIFWREAKTKRLFSQCIVTWAICVDIYVTNLAIPV
jgi:hypothetical protein